MLHILMRIKKAKEQFTNNFILPQCLRPDHIAKLMRDEEDDDSKDDWDGLFLSNNTTSEIVNYYTANQAHQRSSTGQSSLAARTPSNVQRVSNVKKQPSAQTTTQSTSNTASHSKNASSTHHIDSVQNWADFSFDQW